ncbi:hypothetical protein L2E82_51193 [Cichorium intybus]|nr:hypothetical protein L2E82_51193 [Cichorium intybus]
MVLVGDARFDPGQNSGGEEKCIEDRFGLYGLTLELGFRIIDQFVSIAKEVGIDDFIAEAKPEDKAEKVKEL